VAITVTQKFAGVLQEGTGNNAAKSGSTGLLAFAANSLIVVVVGVDRSNSTTQTCHAVTGTGLTFMNRGAASATGEFKGSCAIFTAPFVAGGSVALTISSNAVNAFCAHGVVWEVTGHDTTTPIGATATGFSDTDNEDGAKSITLSAGPATSSYVFAGVSTDADPGTNTIDPGADFDSVTDVLVDSTGANFGSTHGQYRTGSTSTTVGWADIRGGAAPQVYSYGAVAIEVRAAAGGGNVSGTANATLGGLTATAIGQVTGEVSATANLGGLSATATGVRETSGTATASLGGLTATAAVPSGLWPTTRSGRKILDQHGSPWQFHAQALWSLGTMSQEDQIIVLDALAEHHHNSFLITLTENNYSNNVPPTENFYGEEPFIGTWFASSLTAAYWDRLLNLCDLAAARGITVIGNPAYCGFIDGDGVGAEMSAVSNAQMETFGADLATLFLDKPNVVWMIGGDRQFLPGSTLGQRYNALVNGITSVDPGRLIIGHTNRNQDGTDQWGSGYTVAFLDWQTVYTTSGDGVDKGDGAWTKAPNLPMAFEEGEYWHGGGIGDPAMRHQAYMGCLWGGGIIDGHVSLWSFGSDGGAVAWPDNLTSVEMDWVGYCYDFFDSLNWGQTLPDFDAVLLTTGQSTGTSRASVAYGSTLGILYFPNSRAITCDLTEFSGSTVTARWFDPTDASYTAIGNFSTAGSQSFTHPGNTSNSDGAGDWVLVLESDGVISGNATASLGGLTATATGVRNTSGTATATLGGLVATATGVRNTSGTASATLGGLTASAVGQIEGSPVGSATATLGALTATASGKRAVYGTASAALGGLTAHMSTFVDPVITGPRSTVDRTPPRSTREVFDGV